MFYNFIILELTKHELDVYITKYDVKRLEMYSDNLVDYHLIVDLMPILARIYFLNQMSDVQLSAVQAVRKILLLALNCILNIHICYR